MKTEVSRAAQAPSPVWTLAGDAEAANGKNDPRRYSRSANLDFTTLLRIVKDWRWLILGTVAVGLALGLITALLSTPLYRSKAILEANPPSVEVMDEKSNAGGGAAQTSWDFVSTQVGLLGSRSLAERVAKDLGLAENGDFVDLSLDAAARKKAATDEVAQGLSIKAPEQGQLIGIEFVSTSPQLAAQVVNGVADSFIRTNLERRYDASAYARNFLQRQIAKTRADLERSERQLVGYAQSQGIIDTGGRAQGDTGGDVNSLQGASLVALNSALAQATARRIAAEGAYRQGRNSGNTTEVNESTQGMRQSKATLEAEYQDKRTLMKPDHPEMLSLRSRIAELDRQISIETSKVAGGRANSLLADYQAAAQAERALQSKVAGLKGSVLNLRGRSIQYTILQREVDTNRALYDALLQRYKEIGVAGGVGTNLISVVDRGEVPSQPYKPSFPFNLLVGTLLGLLGGIIIAVLLEVLNDTIKTRDDIRQKLGLACLGAIPKRAAKGSFIDDLKDPTSSITEAYSAVLASLRWSTETGAPKTLLISSTRESEGKSSTALALSQNLGRLGKSVLLIDCDLRKPTFKAADGSVGLTPLLTTEDATSEHILRTQFENLWLMPCGPIPPNPADLLSTGRFQSILDDAAAHFDFVIVDAPPVLGLADAPLLAASCEGTLMVVEADRTRTHAVISAINRLEAAGAHMVGALLTKSSEKGGTFGYGYEPYKYGVGTNNNQILMIPHQRDA